MDKVNAGRNAPERCSTLSQFIEDVWLPFIENRLSSSTVSVYKFYWNHILKPRCGDKLLRDFSTPSGQALLDDVARHNPEMRAATLHKLKCILSAVFKLAIQQDYRPGPNPMRETSLPRAPEAQETHAYDLQTIRTVLALVPETAKVIVALAAYAGLSKSEIQGLVWEAYDGRELGVLSSVVNGKRGEPKTKARKATVPLIEPIRNLLEIHRLRMGNPANGVMFPTKNGTPLSLHNILNDYIVPVVNRCQECGKGKTKHDGAGHKFTRDASLPEWHGWHAFRRGLATNLHDLGVDDKTIQRILRHSDVSITQKAYIKTIPRQVTDAMAQLEEAIRKEGERPISVQ
jgi:integrase